ncbi:MAG TPA: BatA and WFA domain-containing protein [Phycisphaerales bacterium]|nr:BatA and WFA domain-containing protein [Phycisphaerales bacterium]
MTLLAPWALWFLVVAGGVVALYLLKIKRRSATVPALDFWLSLAGQTKVHTLWNRLKRLLSMLLWLVIVTCLILALGNPILSLGKIKPRAIAVVIDNSASMQAIEKDDGASEGETRLALARKAVEEISRGRPVADEWLLIEAGREPRVLQAWTFDAKAVRTAAGKVTPFGGKGDVAAGVELAGQLTAGKNDPCIVVISDGAAGSVQQLATSNPGLIYWPIGTSTDNIGIGQLAVRPHRQNGNYQALITLVNASDVKVDTSVTLEVDGRSQSVELASIEPGATWEKVVAIEAPTGGVLRASIDRADALAADNEAYAILEPIRPAVVWLVTPRDSAFFFEQALGSMNELVWAEESLTLPPAQFAAAWDAAHAASKPAEAQPGTNNTASIDTTIRKPDLVIFNGWTPDKLPAIGRFVVVNGCPAELGTLGGEIAEPSLHVVPRPHPLMQHVTLQGARVAKGEKATLKQPARVLANSADGDPLLFLVDQPSRQVLCLAFDVVASDLPFRNAFPLLLRNTVSFMHEEAPSWLRSGYAVGETVRPVRTLPANTTKLAAKALSAGKQVDLDLPVKDGTFTYDGTFTPGALRVQVGDEASFAAINIGDEHESRIAVAAAAEDPAQKLGLSRGLLGAMPWTLLACVAAFGVAFEWLSYHLRWTE